MPFFPRPSGTRRTGCVTVFRHRRWKVLPGSSNVGPSETQITCRYLLHTELFAEQNLMNLMANEINFETGVNDQGNLSVVHSAMHINRVHPFCIAWIYCQ